MFYLSFGLKTCSSGKFWLSSDVFCRSSGQ